jgi:hypothetical protein
MFRTLSKGLLVLAALLAVAGSGPIWGAVAQPPAAAGMRWVPVDELTDEFNGNSLNLDKWSNDNAGMWPGRLPSQFATKNAWVSGGHLHLRNSINEKYGYLSDAEAELGASRAYTTHWVDSAKVYATRKIAQPGWYYESRLRASDTALSSSFWFRMSDYSEIDVIEHIGHATKSEDVAERKAHAFESNTWIFGKYAASGAPPSQPVKVDMARRGRDDFASYGVHWVSPNLLVFYHNGREVMRTEPQRPFDEKLTMIFDTEALYSQGNGLPTVASLCDEAKNTMLVDWVHTFRLEAIG